ncbi:helix-turn-helix domain-containing protein [Inquilinus sp. OTU3971]|uniref:helix-turn-helix domain-containing protein n=1 Tax=Inquilinus sp. OTU3971 TaxID=3043855 RepID=UPI00313DF441
MSKFGQDLIESAREALAIAQGRSEAARSIPVPDVDVSAIRKRLGLSQSAFAAKFGFSVSAVRDWEQHRKVPEPATPYLPEGDREGAGGGRTRAVRGVKAAGLSPSASAG